MASSSFNPIHLNHPVAIKLTRNNFLSWQSQITPILYSHGLLKFLESSPPNQFLHPTYLSQINPAYSSWRIQDQMILSWLRSSLSDTILGQVASCTTSRKLWTSLQSITSSSLQSVTSPSALYTNPRPNTNGYRPNGNGYRPANGAQTIRPRCPRPSGPHYSQQLQSQPSLTQPTLGLSPQQPTPTLPLPPPKPLPELLKEHDLPPGLFPKNITGYNFDVNTKKITVNMPGVFNVSNLQFSNTVTGSLEKGRLHDIKGIKTPSLILEEVRCIEIKTIDGTLFLDLNLTAGKGHKRRHFKEFTTLKDGIPC